MAKEELTWEKVEEILNADQELLQALRKTTSLKEADVLLKAAGISYTAKEMLDALDEKPLTAEELSKVSGGIGTEPYQVCPRV